MYADTVCCINRRVITMNSPTRRPCWWSHPVAYPYRYR